ncbi:MAG: hypothetical protein ACRDWT_09430 [Jatrophihabitantaceae bacterium]
MFCCLLRLYRKIRRQVLRAATILAWRLAHRCRRAWAAHGARVSQDATYAAATVLVLSGLFGMVPVKDVLAAVLAALLGVYMPTRPGDRRAGHRTTRWDDGDLT